MLLQQTSAVKFKFFLYIIPTYKICGRVAQLVEHHLDMVVVDGSSPFVATTYFPLNIDLQALYECLDS